MRILISGSNGFVGSALLRTAFQLGFTVNTLSRNPCNFHGISVQSFIENPIQFKNLDTALEHCDAVVHLAARAHVSQTKNCDSLNQFRKTNVELTLTLARQAAQSGVKRFIFISSIGVNGAVTHHSPFTAEDQPAPHSFYAISKHEAEIGLQEIAAQTGMEVVIIRPPLIYGPNAPGNFGLLLRWINRGVPLPLGAISNKRSLVAIDNFVDFILTCISHPSAANQIFLVSDGEDISTTELLRKVGLYSGHPARLIPISTKYLTSVARILGKTSMCQSLCESLQVDISKSHHLLGWKPPISLDEGIRRSTAKDLS